MPHNVLIINPKHLYRLSSPPLGIGYILAYNRKISDNTIIFLDENFVEYPDNEILKVIKYEKVDFVGISFPSAAIKRVIDICKLIRSHFESQVLLFAGGYHPTSEPELTLRLIPYFDFIVIGESEHIVSHLNSNWKNLDNIAYLEDNKIIKKQTTYLNNIDEIPYPYRNDFDKRYFIPDYGIITGIYGRVATIISSRGCPYCCNFCSSKIIQKTVRHHSTQYVLSEIDHILSTLGKIDYLYFLDVMFLAKRDRIEELCFEMIRHKLNKQFKWAATTTSNVVNIKIIKLMKEAGCFYLSFGFESNSALALKLMNKISTPEDNKKACEICSKYRIYINSAFLFGIPGENDEDLQKTIDFVKKYNVHFTGVNIMKPLPGSPFYYNFVKKGIIKPSIEEWHEVSQINVEGKIYNDKLSKEQYNKYIIEFYKAIKIRQKYNNLSANWHKKLKYIFKKYGNNHL